MVFQMLPLKGKAMQHHVFANCHLAISLHWKNNFKVICSSCFPHKWHLSIIRCEMPPGGSPNPAILPRSDFQIIILSVVALHYSFSYKTKKVEMCVGGWQRHPIMHLIFLRLSVCEKWGQFWLYIGPVLSSPPIPLFPGLSHLSPPHNHIR